MIRARLTAPIIHLNGTSKENLLENLETAYAAIDTAREALRQTAPNGRDYYLVPGTLDAATQEHFDRLKRLDSVQTELQALCEAILAQEK